jgi:hypothetical protein
MAASEAALSGGYRAAHQRLVAAAEEVAFNEPASGATAGLPPGRNHERRGAAGACAVGARPKP